MITICFTYFKTLALANLAAALYSVRRQDFKSVDRLIIVDNDTTDSAQEIRAIADELAFPIPVDVQSYKHGDPLKTQSWSTNTNVRLASSPWVFYTRADYLLAFDAVHKHAAEVRRRGREWNGFITGDGCFVSGDIAACEASSWRQTGPRFLGVAFDYTCIDTGVWLARRDAFERINGLDESLTAWGHAQTDFQYRMYLAGVEFVRIPEVLYWHPTHAAPRNLELAHRQLSGRGGDLRAMWARYHGGSPYA